MGVHGGSRQGLPPTGAAAGLRAPMLHQGKEEASPMGVEEEIERVRRVFDEQASGRPHNSINTPREDAKQFRSSDKHTVPCECIVELYELLWRWGHRTNERAGSPSFVKNFGFALPDTVIIVKGEVYAWYFISKKDGRLLRKSASHLNVSTVEKKLCRGAGDEGTENQVCGVWMPAYSQFPEARCHNTFAEFSGADGLAGLLGSLRNTHNGVIQAFVQPPGISNHLVRTVTYSERTSIMVRVNRKVLNAGSGNMFDRAATFEGWEGLSSSSSTYKSHKFPHMEELMLAVGESLNRRIEEENLRQMLFLEDNQHVALHFKVGRDGMLFFIFGSVISEREVILQSREKLLMGDRVMTEELPSAALLRGGTRQSDGKRLHIPYEVRHDMSRWYPNQQSWEDELPTPLYDNEDEDDILLAEARGPEEASPRAGSLPPIRLQQQQMLGQGAPQRQERSTPRGPLSARGSSVGRRSTVDLAAGTIPRMAYPHPVLPAAPFQVNPVGDKNVEKKRYETLAARAITHHDLVKRPLIQPATGGAIMSARSLVPLSSSLGGLAPPMSARLERGYDYNPG